MILDCHTHDSRPQAVVNIDPVSVGRHLFHFEDDRLYTVGIHPWNAGCYTVTDLNRLARMARDPHVVAIGETGLDSVHDTYVWIPDGKGKGADITLAHPDVEKQIELLRHHIDLSESLRKPLILHVVKRFPEIMKLRIKLKPRMPWVIHGFRGKPGLARDLIRWGFYLSYGEKFNEASVRATPPDRMLVETDESRMSIDDIVASLPVKPQMTLPLLLEHCAEIPKG